MLGENHNFIDQLYEFICKIFFPAFSGVSIKLATMMSKERITPLRAILSYIVGIGITYLTYPFVIKYASEDLIPFFIGIIAMSGEKMSEFIIYKWNIDLFLTSLLDAFREVLIKLIKK